MKISANGCRVAVLPLVRVCLRLGYRPAVISDNDLVALGVLSGLAGAIGDWLRRQGETLRRVLPTSLIARGSTAPPGTT